MAGIFQSFSIFGYTFYIIAVCIVFLLVFSNSTLIYILKYVGFLNQRLLPYYLSLIAT